MCPRVKYDGNKPSVNTTQFATESAFEHHLLESHAKAVSARMRLSLLDTSRRTAPVELKECPLCGMTNTSNKLDKIAFLDHISVELRSFAMRSLPWHDRKDAGVTLAADTRFRIEAFVQNETMGNDEIHSLGDLVSDVRLNIPVSATAKVKAWLIGLESLEGFNHEFPIETPYEDTPTPSMDSPATLSAEDHITQWKKFLHDEKAKFGIINLAPLSRSEEGQDYFQTNEYFPSETASFAPLTSTRAGQSDGDSEQSPASKLASSASPTIVHTRQGGDQLERPAIPDTAPAAHSTVTQMQQSDNPPVKLAESEAVSLVSSTVTQQQEFENPPIEQPDLPVSHIASPTPSAVTQTQESDDHPFRSSVPENAHRSSTPASLPLPGGSGYDEDSVKHGRHPPPGNRQSGSRVTESQQQSYKPQPPDAQHGWRFDVARREWYYLDNRGERVYHNSTPRVDSRVTESQQQGYKPQIPQPPDAEHEWRFDATRREWFYLVNGNHRVYHDSTARDLPNVSSPPGPWQQFQTLKASSVSNYRVAPGGGYVPPADSPPAGAERGGGYIPPLNSPPSGSGQGGYKPPADNPPPIQVPSSSSRLTDSQKKQLLDAGQ